jgi:hypothetical protein
MDGREHGKHIITSRSCHSSGDHSPTSHCGSLGSCLCQCSGICGEGNGTEVGFCPSSLVTLIILLLFNIHILSRGWAVGLLMATVPLKHSVIPQC